MYFQQDMWMLKKIFQLSDQALIRMINRLFQTEYADEETVLKEWAEKEPAGVQLTVGCANRYVFRLRRLEGCVRIYAEDKGCAFQYGSPVIDTMVQIREPQMTYFGKSKKEEYCTMLELSGHERISLPLYMITLADSSAWELEASGLILFLPFLFCCFAENQMREERKQESLKYFVIHDIVGALYLSLKKGDLTVYDMQKMKQFCRQMIWKLFACEPWMQDLELQELLLKAFETDLDLLERIHRLEVQRVRINE